ncbi:prolyl oligopeptidase family serine peptidase [Candidatus Sumerlaeota bacterium]|nr:prolyl oligopeptidase family serine peptidase [Candidatus Sumerlaeota bacterium]
MIKKVNEWALVVFLALFLFHPGMMDTVKGQSPPASGIETALLKELRYEISTIKDQNTTTTIHLLYKPILEKHPVILMLGSIDPKEPPFWSIDLLKEGYMLSAFTVAYPPDPDPARRLEFLYFDERFAHMYPLLGKRCITDTDRMIHYLGERKDVDTRKIGWLGSSTTGIPALCVATQGSRLAAIVVFVSTGAYRRWLETWHTNGLWKGKTNQLWPETEELLNKYDPILHVDRMYPTPVLMVNGGEDKVVDPAPVREFMAAARTYYEKDPHRLRLVIYEGFGHNLPLDVVKMYAENWFHLYMHPEKPVPEAPDAPADLNESVKKTQINKADHRDIIGEDK